MKLFVFFLIIVNLLAFAWIRQHDSSATDGNSTELAVTPSGLQPLRLLSETQPANPEVTPSDHHPVELAATETEPGPSGPLPDSEDRAQPAAAETRIAKADLAHQAKQNDVCQTVGPFVNRAVLDDGTAWLKKWGREGVVRSEDSRELRDYWVYLPSMPADDADRTIREFKSKGVKDYYRGRRDEISLGIYSKEDVAERRRSQIAALGYTPVLVPRYRDRTVYWLDFRESGSDTLTDREWAGFLVNHPNLVRQPAVCP